MSNPVVVAGHGDFAAGLVSAVEAISGRGDRFVAISNRDADAREIEARMRSLVERGSRLILTDLQAGSCTMAARRLQRDFPSLTVVTGVNLALLLDYAFADTHLPGDAATAHAVNAGRQALQQLHGPESAR